MDKEEIVKQYSDPEKVYSNLQKYAPNIKLFFSAKKDKKYTIIHPETGKLIHFGQIGFQDFTKTNDPIKRDAYLKRSAGIKGNWKSDKFSANNLARNLLW
jgi:hypothetical protein